MIILIFLSIKLTNVRSGMNANCLSLQLSDLMGDTWHNAGVIVSITTNDKFVSQTEYSIGKESHLESLMICVDADQESSVTLSGNKLDTDDLVECPWEMHWTVKANDGRLYQAGTFNTTMTLLYAPSSWNLIAGANLQRMTYTCAVQIGSLLQTCSTSKNHILSLSSKISIITNNELINSNIPTNNQIAIQTYDSLSEGWFIPSGRGTNWYITDESRAVPLVVGSMIPGMSMQRTVLSIPNGSYYLRVTGSLDLYAKNHYWYFCGVYGSAGDELSFFIQDGECLASQHYSSKMLKSGRIQTTLSIHGSMAVSGVSTEVTIDTGVLSQLKQTLIEGTSSNYLQHAQYQITAFSFSKARKLSSEVLGVQFSTSLILEEFGVDGTNKYRLSKFADEILSEIHTFIDSGDYYTTLRRRAYELNDEFIMTLSSITLNELKISEVAYKLLSDISNSDDSEHSTSFTSPTSYALNMILYYIISFGFLIGSAIFLGILIWFISYAKSRRTLDDSDSEEDDDENDRDNEDESDDGINSHTYINKIDRNRTNQEEAEEEKFEEHFILRCDDRSLQQLDTVSVLSDIASTTNSSHSSSDNTEPSITSSSPFRASIQNASRSGGIQRQTSRSGHLAIGMPLPFRS